MIELLHVHKIIPMGQTNEEARELFNPKLPWADMHFGERVSGLPLNPPPSHKYWARNLEDYFEGDGDKFSHSYPERMWPRSLFPSSMGYRYHIADLNTLVGVLKKDPTTRQAYLPIFFPEDLSASLDGERVPCTLGWHFIIRNGRLDVFYPMRSVDAVRHFHNDLYLVNRLAIWVIESADLEVDLGVISFSATSFHAFYEDKKLWDKGLIK